jgi:hypothetical protein
MSDDTIMETEQVVERLTKIPDDGPFAVKWMHGTDKLLITKAAKRARKTVGEWLAEAARAYVDAERESIDAEVMRPDHSRSIALLDPPKPLSIEELDRALDLAVKIYGIEGREVPKRGGLVSATKRQLKYRLIGQ